MTVQKYMLYNASYDVILFFYEMILLRLISDSSILNSVYLVSMTILLTDLLCKNYALGHELEIKKKRFLS